jgi:raffinose/stachyose/melibiose transport system permease protein
MTRQAVRQTVPRHAGQPGVDGPEAGPPAARRPGRSVGRGRGPSGLTISLFLLPGVVLFGVMVVLPMLVAIYVSMFRWDGFGGLPPGPPLEDFVGLDNYVWALNNDIFRGDLWRALVLVLLSVGTQLPIALALALLLHQKFPGRALFRLLFFAPFIISEVITAVLFRSILRADRDPDTGGYRGLANNLLDLMGLNFLIPEEGWLANRSIVLLVVFLVVSWKYFGFHMIIYLAGRQAIPRELTEAAATDGATPWRIFRHVTLPLMGPTIRVSIFLSIIGVIQLFDMVFALTQGGPLHSSETMALTMYDTAFDREWYGEGSAISVLMFVIAMVFALLYIRFVMRRDIEGAITTMGGRNAAAANGGPR